MNAVFFGLGSIGQRHARLLHDHFHASIWAVRTRRGQSPVRDLAVREVTLDEAARADVAFVTNPTHLHGATALELVRQGMKKIFLEKPIDCDAAQVRRLLRSRAAIQVGYPLPFHPVARALRKIVSRRRVYHVRMVCSSWLPEWRPGQDYRRSYSADSRRGGGVLLDLSHELDLLEVITGHPIEAIGGRAWRSGRLPIRAEDTADLQVDLRGGARASVHLDFCSRRQARSIELDFDDGFVRGDLLEGVVDDGRRTRRVGCGEMFVDQLRHFLRSGRGELFRDFKRQAEMTLKLLAFRKAAVG